MSLPQAKTIILSLVWAIVTAMLIGITWFGTPIVIEMSKPQRNVAQDPTGLLKIDKYSLQSLPNFSEYRCNPQRTGFIPAKSGIRIASVIWRKKTTDPYTSKYDDPSTCAPCVVTPEFVISPGLKGNIIAIDPNNGEVKWKTELYDKDENKVNDRIGALSANQEFVFAASLESSKHIWVLNRQTGKTIWTTQLPAGCYSPPLLIQNALVLHGTDGFIEGYVKNDKQWLLCTGSDAYYPPSIIPKTNNAIILNSDGRIYRINLLNGHVVWVSNLANDTGSAATILQNMCYVTDRGGFVSAINVKDGTLEWRVDAGKLPLDSPASDGQTLIVSGRFSDTCIVKALSIKSGNIIWQTEVKNLISYFDPYIIGDQVLIACSDQRLHLSSKKAELILLNIKDGKETQRYQLHYVPGQSITITDGNIWINTIQGYMLKVAYN